MSPRPAIALRHHLYGSTQRGFATVVEPAGGLDRRELAQVERRCGYALPSRLVALEDAVRPVKHTIFTVGDTLVLGRTTYQGIDVTGRRGNYLTHNILVPKVDAFIWFDDPLTLSAQLEAAGLFVTEVPPDGIPVGPDAFEPSDDILPAAALSEETVRALLTLFCAWSPQMPPALLLGDDVSIRGALAAALRILPNAIRWNLPIDTYVLGADWRELAAIGLPAEREYQGAVSAYSLTVDVSADSVQWKREIPADPFVSHLLGMRDVSDTQRLAFFSLIDLFESDDWAEVAENLDLVDERSSSLLYGRYRERILKHLSTEPFDARLFDAAAARITAADFDTLARTPSFDAIVGAPRYAETVLRAAVECGPHSRVIGWIARNPALLETFLSVHLGPLHSQRAIPYLTALLSVVPSMDQRVEELVLIEIIKATGIAGETAQRATAAIRSLAPTTGYREGLRRYARAILGDGEALKALVDGRELLVATAGAYPWMLDRLMTLAVRNGHRLKTMLATLFSASLGGAVPGDVMASAVIAILGDDALDPAARRQLAKDVMALASRVEGYEWGVRLVSVAQQHVGRGFGSMFRKGGS